MPEDKGKAAGVGGTRAAQRGASSRVLRIIGGTWRSRRFRFPAGLPLRPTPDRVRETLFNWLAPHVRGARCLDLFAGSGALGLEALSRGAGEVIFVEQARAAAEGIRSVLNAWETAAGRVVVADALEYLALDTAATASFDIVFLDPPFDSGLLPRALAALVERRRLRPGALVYVEFSARSGRPGLPPPFTLHKEGRSGEVGYDLLCHIGGEGAIE
jgi:16S rRNA (guanine966-N2)-methyltransferase